MKKLLLVLGLSVALSAPSVVSAEATWYGSLRAGVASDKGDTKFADGGSRWGIKGSNEISDGLTAVYRFEHKIDTAKASLTGGGRLAYAGLKGGFGTITAGQIWSASFNSVGAITDNSFAYGNSETTYRHGSVVSYANSFGPASVQLDLVMDGGKNTGKDIDQVEFGLSVALGDIGKIAIAHVNKEDSMPRSRANMLAVYKHTINGTIYYSPKAWSDKENKAWVSTGTLITIAVAPVTEIVAKNSMHTISPTSTVSSRTAEGHYDIAHSDLDKTNLNLYIRQCNPDLNAKDVCVTRTSKRVYATPQPLPNSPTQTGPGTANLTAYSYLADDIPLAALDGSKSNHFAAEFSFGGVTPHLGYSEKKMNGKTKKDKTTFVGVRGSVGDTGFGYVFQYRDKENADGTKPEPWILGLSKTMGGGASLHFEHSDPGVKNMKSTTGVWLKVDF